MRRLSSMTSGPRSGPASDATDLPASSGKPEEPDADDAGAAAAAAGASNLKRMASLRRTSSMKGSTVASVLLGTSASSSGSHPASPLLAGGASPTGGHPLLQPLPGRRDSAAAPAAVVVVPLELSPMTEEERFWKASVNLIVSHKGHQELAARQLQTMPALVAKMRQAIDAETVWQTEQQKRSRVLAGVTRSLFDQIAETREKNASLRSRIELVERDRAGCVAKDKAAQGMRSLLEKRRGEVQELRGALVARRAQLHAKKEALAGLLLQLATAQEADDARRQGQTLDATDFADDAASASGTQPSPPQLQQQPRLELGGFLPPPPASPGVAAEQDPLHIEKVDGDVNRAARPLHIDTSSDDDGDDGRATAALEAPASRMRSDSFAVMRPASTTSSSHASTAATGGDAAVPGASSSFAATLLGNGVLAHTSAESWLAEIRPAGPVLLPFVACPFTEFAALGANYIKNPFRAITETLVQTVMQSSPLPVSLESFDGNAYHALYDTDDLSAKTSELEQRLREHERTLAEARKAYVSRHRTRGPYK